MTTNRSEYMQSYYQKNRSKWEHLREKVTCEVCNRDIAKDHMSRHVKTRRHIKKMTSDLTPKDFQLLLYRLVNNPTAGVSVDKLQ